MKIKFLTTGMAALSLTALVSAIPATAQSHLMRFDIPFQFAAGTEVHPAGTYEVQLDQFPRVLLRNSSETTTHFVALPVKYEKRSSQDLAPGILRFDRYAGRMYLTAVWAPGHEDGRTVRLSEEQLAGRNVTGNSGGPANVTLISDVK